MIGTFKNIALGYDGLWKEESEWAVSLFCFIFFVVYLLYYYDNFLNFPSLKHTYL